MAIDLGLEETYQQTSILQGRWQQVQMQHTANKHRPIQIHIVVNKKATVSSLLRAEGGWLEIHVPGT